VLRVQQNPLQRTGEAFLILRLDEHQGVRGDNTGHASIRVETTGLPAACASIALTFVPRCRGHDDDVGAEVNVGHVIPYAGPDEALTPAPRFGGVHTWRSGSARKLSSHSEVPGNSQRRSAA
jgi:hypothetical protein